MNPIPCYISNLTFNKLHTKKKIFCLFIVSMLHTKEWCFDAAHQGVVFRCCTPRSGVSMLHTKEWCFDAAHQGVVFAKKTTDSDKEEFNFFTTDAALLAGPPAIVLSALDHTLQIHLHIYIRPRPTEHETPH